MKGTPAALADLLARALLALALLSAAAPAVAQPGAPQPAAPEQAGPQPLVRATLTPAQVVVGQPATLVVEVMAPNYMTKPPVLPDFQIANAITRSAPNMNFSERQGDVGYAGIRYTFLISPQEPGSYTVTGQPVTITYADNPPHTRAAKVPVPATRFEAVIPDAARGLDPFLSATRLSVSQDIQRSSPSLKVGDSVTRIVTIEAEGAPAILLPPTSFAPIAGAQVYPSQPQLSDGLDQGSGVLTATRTDRATYMLAAAGTLTLPAIEIAWWDVKDEKIQHGRLDPQSFTVAGGTSASQALSAPVGLSAPRRLFLFVLEHWLPLGTVILVAGVLIWATPPTARHLMRRLQRRRVLYRQSEVFAFRDLSRVARQNDPRQTYRALLTWLSRFEPAAPQHTVKALNSWAKDPILAQETAALERQLFATGPGAGAWSGALLIKTIRSMRRKAELRRRNTPMTYALPEDINPETSDAALPPSARPVAR